MESCKNPETVFPYVFLRLPDVIGARDSTNRFWVYQMWLQFVYYLQKKGKNMTIEIPSMFYNKKTSYVYVRDIARTVGLFLSRNVYNEVFNIGIGWNEA